MSARDELIDALARALSAAAGFKADEYDGGRWPFSEYRRTALRQVAGLEAVVGPAGVELIAKAAAVAVAFGKVVGE